MSQLRSEIAQTGDYADLDGAQELIDSHLDDVAGGGFGFGLFGQFNQGGGTTAPGAPPGGGTTPAPEPVPKKE